MTGFVVEPLDVFSTLKDGASYAALIAAVGFESRAVYLASQFARSFGQIWAYEYRHNQVLSYGSNKSKFEGLGLVFDVDDASYRSHLTSRVKALIEERIAAARVLSVEPELRLAVDISSMDRDRIARTVAALVEDLEHSIEIDFYYSVAEFDASLVGSEGRVTVNRAVESLDGWTDNPNLPVACIIGAGFESRLAMAALETLEPATVVWLMPKGTDERYDDVVIQRNHDVSSGQFDVVEHYRIDSPYVVVRDLEATVSSLTLNHRVVIVPLGPKIFALCSTLVGFAHDTNVSVWRLSTDKDRRPEDRRASGETVGLRVRSLGEG